ncbi:MAG: hypothetical protein SFV21_01955 [Rhodospirillaceae bacterium]|nr:hypothetical protein [Rhodospirillaceae bacterium]
MSAILKFVLIAAVIGLVWFVVRTRGRINPLKAATEAARRVAEGQKREDAKSGPPAKVVHDLVACPKCGAFGPTGRPCACEKA